MKHLKSFREFRDALTRIDEVQPINKEVDWNLEIGEIIRHSYELRAPAPLFNCIRGIGPGFRVLGAPGGLRANAILKYSRIAIALGFDPSTPGRSW